MRYRIFGERTGLRVSELFLGGGMFGTGWGYGTEPDEVRRIIDAYAAAGGNFLDTADSYEFGQSESLIGDFLGAERDHFVLATKFSFGATANNGISRLGNSRKSMVQAVEESLKRLRTDRIDLYWVHIPDNVTPIDEIMRGLDDLVRAGKILYAGLSDFPAWRVAGAATLADLRGWAPIAAIQLEYSLVERTSDRELLPMARAHGIAAVGWSPLGGGLLTGKYRRGETGRVTGMGGRLVHDENSAQRTAILDMLHVVADETGSNPGRVAIAWIGAKGVIPVIGPRTLAQLEDNLTAAALALTADQIRRLDEVSAIALGFPHDLIGNRGTGQRLTGGKLDLVDAPAHPVT